jgi:hypothetical protein
VLDLASLVTGGAEQPAGRGAEGGRSARSARRGEGKFLTTYAEVMSLVGAEFPRDKVMQDLFFDEVRTKSAVEAADAGGQGEGEAGAEDATSP